MFVDLRKTCNVGLVYLVAAVRKRSFTFEFESDN